MGHGSTLLLRLCRGQPRSTRAGFHRGPEGSETDCQPCWHSKRINISQPGAGEPIWGPSRSFDAHLAPLSFRWWQWKPCLDQPVLPGFASFPIPNTGEFGTGRGSGDGEGHTCAWDRAHRVRQSTGTRSGLGRHGGTAPRPTGVRVVQGCTRTDTERQRYVYVYMYLYICVRIYTHTHGHGHGCRPPEGCAPPGDGLGARFGSGGSSTDNKMNTDPKTSDTIAQHGVTR